MLKVWLRVMYTSYYMISIHIPLSIEILLSKLTWVYAFFWRFYYGKVSNTLLGWENDSRLLWIECKIMVIRKDQGFKESQATRAEVQDQDNSIEYISAEGITHQTPRDSA